MATVTELADLLGRDETDAVFAASAAESLAIVEQFVRAYTRGVGFDPDPTDDLDVVILAATARLVVNPAQMETERVDAFSATGGFHGFTLVEQLVMNRYRRRTA